MVSRTFSALSSRMSAKPDQAKRSLRNALPHLRWELRQVMSEVRPEDLSAPEISALLRILEPAHTRIIGGPASRPPVFAGGGDDPAPDFVQQ